MKHANNYGTNPFEALKKFEYTTIELKAKPEELKLEEIFEIENRFLDEIRISKREKDEAEKLYYPENEPVYYNEFTEWYYEETKAAYNIEINELWNLNSQFLKNKEFVEYLKENFKDANLVEKRDRPCVRNERGENDLDWHQEITFDIKIVTENKKRQKGICF